MEEDVINGYAYRIIINKQVEVNTGAASLFDRYSMMFDLKLLFVVVLSLLPLLACTQFLKYQNIVPMHNTHILTQLEDLKYQQIIDTFPRNNSEHCVISFTLYGNDKKYTLGALRNAVIAPLYYPGWKVRFYGKCSTVLLNKIYLHLDDHLSAGYSCMYAFLPSTHQLTSLLTL